MRGVSIVLCCASVATTKHAVPGAALSAVGLAFTGSIHNHRRHCGSTGSLLTSCGDETRPRERQRVGMQAIEEARG